jgi:hypothetical protein
MVVLHLIDFLFENIFCFVLKTEKIRKTLKNYLKEYVCIEGPVKQQFLFFHELKFLSNSLKFFYLNDKTMHEVVFRFSKMKT